eukprot:gene2524-3264_t
MATEPNIPALSLNFHRRKSLSVAPLPPMRALPLPTTETKAADISNAPPTMETMPCPSPDPLSFGSKHTLHVLSYGPGGMMAMWDPTKQTKVWQKEVPGTINAVAMDPFNLARCVLLVDCRRVSIIDDLNCMAPPSKVVTLADSGPTSQYADVLCCPIRKGWVYLASPTGILVLDTSLRAFVDSAGTSQVLASAIRKIIVANTLVEGLSPARVYSIHSDGSVCAWRHHLTAAESSWDATPHHVRHGYTAGGGMGWPYYVAISRHDSGQVACVSNDTTLMCWRAAPENKDYPWVMESMVSFLSAKPSAVCACPFAGDLRVAIGHTNGLVSVWDTGSSLVTKRLSVFPKIISALAWLGPDSLSVCGAPQSGPSVGQKEKVAGITAALVGLSTGNVQQFALATARKQMVRLRHMCLSSNGRFAALLLSDHRLEVWDVVTRKLLRVVVAPSMLYCIAWQQISLGRQGAEGPDSLQHLVAVPADSLPMTLEVQPGQVYVAAASTSKEALWKGHTVQCMGWSHNCMVIGDDFGNLLWEHGLSNGTIQTDRAAVAKICVARAPSDRTSSQALFVLCLFRGGTVSSWDILGGKKLGPSGPKSHQPLVEDIAWAYGLKAVLLLASGGILLTDVRLSVSQRAYRAIYLQNALTTANYFLHINLMQVAVIVVRLQCAPDMAGDVHLSTTAEASLADKLATESANGGSNPDPMPDKDGHLDTHNTAETLLGSEGLGEETRSDRRNTPRTRSAKRKAVIIRSSSNTDVDSSSPSDDGAGLVFEDTLCAQATQEPWHP